MGLDSPVCRLIQYHDKDDVPNEERGLPLDHAAHAQQWLLLCRTTEGIRHCRRPDTDVVRQSPQLAVGKGLRVDRRLRVRITDETELHLVSSRQKLHGQLLYIDTN